MDVIFQVSLVNEDKVNVAVDVDLSSLDVLSRILACAARDNDKFAECLLDSVNMFMDMKEAESIDFDTEVARYSINTGDQLQS